MNSTIVNEEAFNWGKFGIALFVWGVIGLLVAGYFGIPDKTDRFDITPFDKSRNTELAKNEKGQPENQIGPIVVNQPGESYKIFIKGYIPDNRWSFVEVEVLNDVEEYLYSFGMELWRESGSDSDGNWSESKTHFETDITFPEPGFYYLNFVVERNFQLRKDKMAVILTKRKGSSLLHFWSGIFFLLTGLILIEVQWGIFRKILESMNEED